jgi:hypothetical protein
MDYAVEAWRMSHLNIEGHALKKDKVEPMERSAEMFAAHREGGVTIVWRSPANPSTYMKSS